MSEVAPLEQVSTSDRVAAAVRRMIWNGELTAGARLNQDELASRFAVSRIPVREALISLAHGGAISMTPNRGAFVEAMTAEMVGDHYELYARVDGFAIEKAMQRGQDLDLLADDLRGVADAADDVDLFDRVVAARRRLHSLGGSPRLGAVSRGLVGLVPGNFFIEVPGTAEIARCQLPLVGDALAADKADRATNHYTKMLQEQGHLVAEQLARNGALLESKDY